MCSIINRIYSNNDNNNNNQNNEHHFSENIGSEKLLHHDETHILYRNDEHLILKDLKNDKKIKICKISQYKINCFDFFYQNEIYGNHVDILVGCTNGRIYIFTKDGYVIISFLFRHEPILRFFSVMNDLNKKHELWIIHKSAAILTLVSNILTIVQQNRKLINDHKNDFDYHFLLNTKSNFFEVLTGFCINFNCDVLDAVYFDLNVLRDGLLCNRRYYTFLLISQEKVELITFTKRSNLTVKSVLKEMAYGVIVYLFFNNDEIVDDGFVKVLNKTFKVMNENLNIMPKVSISSCRRFSVISCGNYLFQYHPPCNGQFAKIEDIYNDDCITISKHKSQNCGIINLITPSFEKFDSKYVNPENILNDGKIYLEKKFNLKHFKSRLVFYYYLKNENIFSIYQDSNLIFESNTMLKIIKKSSVFCKKSLSKYNTNFWLYDEHYNFYSINLPNYSTFSNDPELYDLSICIQICHYLQNQSKHEYIVQAFCSIKCQITAIYILKFILQHQSVENVSKLMTSYQNEIKNESEKESFLARIYLIKCSVDICLYFKNIKFENNLCENLNSLAEWSNNDKYYLKIKVLEKVAFSYNDEILRGIYSKYISLVDNFKQFFVENYASKDIVTHLLYNDLEKNCFIKYEILPIKLQVEDCSYLGDYSFHIMGSYDAVISTKRGPSHMNGYYPHTNHTN
ncbi:hypothetical protein A3Q56_03329 [Intoshia linei]|uniref:Uncharacterized protein n=1 Tax=Intoshia linei TaxID=1819745 RepID=A0A177B5E2_9BILA|nr:hypothetical protein A3Q56_03329 [Intoshia linei]